MTSFIGSAAALTVLAILLLALVEHALSPATLARALVSQRVLPPVLAGPVAGAVVGVEAVLVGLGVFGVAAGPNGTAVLEGSPAAGALLFGVYAAYSAYLVARRHGVPCGCSRGDTPMNHWVVARAMLLALLAAVGALLAEQLASVTQSAAQFAVVLAAALTFAVLLWHLPIAMHDPAETVLLQGRQRVQRRIQEGSRV